MNTANCISTNGFILAQGVAPEGFDTVASFIARTWPHEVEGVLDVGGDALTAYRDHEERELRTASAILGLTVHEVQQGGTLCPAFDARLLAVLLPRL